MSSSHLLDFVLSETPAFSSDLLARWDAAKPLPKLPVPGLTTTFDRYRKSMKPILSDPQYTRLDELAENFMNSNQGKSLQERLIEFAKIEKNWAYQFWLDDMYLNIRLPLVLHSNPGMAFPPRDFANDTQWLNFAARLVGGIAEFTTILTNLPPDRANARERGQPLCMEQYHDLFRTYRLPGLQKDEHLISDDTRTDQHIIVIYRNQIFRMDVVRCGKPIAATQLTRNLSYIVESTDENNQKCFSPVGALTTWGRSKWANSREQLLASPVNMESLQAIETSIFVLCLDDETDSANDTARFNQMLHGTMVNCANRWYDKTLQVIVSRNGVLGLNYEHSVAEGIAVIRIMELVLKYISVETGDDDEAENDALPVALQWDLGGQVEADINEASDSVLSLIANLDSKVFRFYDFGRDFPKQHKISPDSFIQLAMQLSYYRTHGHLVSTYESASLRRFQGGRVDNIRSQSPETLEWVKAMDGQSEDRMAKLRKALSFQTEFMTQTILGSCMDCHLVALREVAHKQGLPTPDIFADETFQNSQQFTLSTSQVPTATDSYMGYGPVVPNGYGVAYNPKNDSIIFCFTAWKDSEESNLNKFTENLNSALIDMKNLCVLNQ